MSYNNTTTNSEIVLNQMKQKSVMPFWRLCLFVCFEYAIILYLSYNVGLLVPLHIMKLAGPKDKASVLGVVSTLSAICILVSGVLTGMISDRLQTRIGRRKPILILSTIVMTLTLIVRSVMPMKKGSKSHLVTYCALYFVGSTAMSSAISAYKAMTPDLIHSSQMGMVSGMIGFAYTMGYIVSLSVFGLFFKLIPEFYTSGIVIVTLILATIGILALFREPDSHYTTKVLPIDEERIPISTTGSIIIYNDGSVERMNGTKPSMWEMFKDLLRTNPLLHWNFFWVYVSRFMYNFGFFLVQGYMLYFFTDAFGSDFTILFWSNLISSPIKANSMYSLFKYLSSLFSSVLGGAVSDKTGRKPFVLLSAILIALGAIGTACFRNYSVVLALAIVMGLGFGSHHAVDMGLVNDVLPSVSNTARDMSIWQTSLTLPHLLAPPVAGFAIKYCDKLFAQRVLPPHFGYSVIFIMCALSQVLSALSIALVRSSPASASATKSTEPSSSLSDEEIGIESFYYEPVTKRESESSRA